jgi:drug/metabolite transporter (DMT)-like permease
MYAVSKVLLQVIPPFAHISLWLFIAVVALAILPGMNTWSQITFIKFWVFFGVEFLGYGISLGFQFVGTKLSTASNDALVTSATPAFVFIIAWLLLQEQITTSRLIALLLSTLGVIAVIDPQTAVLKPDPFLGDLSLLASAIIRA